MVKSEPDDLANRAAAAFWCQASKVHRHEGLGIRGDIRSKGTYSLCILGDRGTNAKRIMTSANVHMDLLGRESSNDGDWAEK